jgi:tRNA dimethylallyltransferase
VAGCRDLRVGLMLERSLLNERINRRVDRMFERGIVEETRRLLARGVPPGAPPFRALGYAQVLRHLEGEISLEEAVESTKQATRQYAKRQMTWFRRTDRVEWFSPGDTEKITACVGNWIGFNGKDHPRSPLDRSE